MTRCQRGSRLVIARQLDELFRRYRTVAYRVAYRLLGREADALDAVQDGFVNALTHLDRFHGRSSFKTWLLRVVCNRRARMWGGSESEMNAYHKRRVTLRRTTLGRTTHRPPMPVWNEPTSRRAINAALARLPEPQRQTFVLHIEGGLTYREVAEALGISIGTVMSRLFYARQKLKTCWRVINNHELRHSDDGPTRDPLFDYIDGDPDAIRARPS